MVLQISLVSSCVKSNSGVWDDLSPRQKRKTLVHEAERFGHRKKYRVNNRSFHSDCSGFVASVYYQNGIDLFAHAVSQNIRGNGVSLIYEYVLRAGVINPKEPKVGDLIFFSNTYDRNKNRKNDDLFTHIGIIVKIRKDGTVAFLHRLNKSRAEIGFMNLNRPHRRTNQRGEIINTYLRRKRPKDVKGTGYTAGALFESFGGVVKDFWRKPTLLSLDEKS